MKKFHIFLAIIFLAAVSFTSCSKELRWANKKLKKGTIEEKDSAAMVFYRAKDYEKAAFIIEDLISVYRGKQREEEMLFYYGNCKYGLSEYVMAAYYYEQYVRKFPNGKKVEDAAFMQADCFYRQSDVFYLDQSYTLKAMEQLQGFINAYPVSSRVKEAEQCLSELQGRKSIKSYEQAKLYYKVGNYKSAVQALQTFNEEYPDSKYREESNFLIVKSAVMLAEQSVQAKKVNRFLDALEYYQKFIDKFPKSNFLKDAETWQKRAQKGLEKAKAEKELQKKS